MTVLRSFLELCNDFRRFVPNSAHFAAPLNKKLREGHPQSFDGLTDDEIAILGTLKAKLVEPAVMDDAPSLVEYTVHTDACEKQIGCVML